jgi:hypothetical protein
MVPEDMSFLTNKKKRYQKLTENHLILKESE